MQISLFDHSLPYNLNLTTAILSRAATRLTDAEHRGVYVEMEQRDYDAALLLIDHAQEQMHRGSSAESYADLRQAYTLVGFIIDKLARMFQDAVSSTIIIILFFTFTASALSHLLVEHWAQKVLVLSVFYALFLLVLSQIYVGIRLVEFPMLLILITGAWCGVALISVLAPRLLKSTTAAIFEMAKRNLRGRRFRVFSTLFTVMVFVMAFVAFTSVSTEYGFTTSSNVIETASEGIVVRQPTPNWEAQIHQEHVQTQRVSSFLPFATATLDWLHRKPDVNLVAPKVENWPSRRPIGSMVGSDERVSLYGIVGILPSTEAVMTHLDDLVIEGRYLRDDEYDAVLLSTTTAATLRLSVGDSVRLQIGVPRSMTVVGLIDDDGFRQHRDIDGSLMLPQKLYMYTDVDILISWWLEPCTPSEVIIVHWQTALQLSQYTAEDVSPLELASLQSTPILISRFNIHAAESVDLLAFARQLALESEYWVWATLGTRVHFFALQQFVEVKGFLVLIPWMIVVLNVAITMINTIYERRRDIHILASVGLNPTHLASLFGVEALLIGGIGGSLGYLMGLSLYKVMLLLSLDLAVQQKISAVWSLAALGIAVIAVGVGVFMAMRLSTIITPSLLRRWQARGQSQAGEWVYSLPVKVPVEDVESMLTYIHRLLKSYEQAPDIWVDRLLRDDADAASNLPKRIVFTCHHGRGINHYLSRNQIVALKDPDDEVYRVELVSSRTIAANANTTARFVRHLFLMWSARRKDDSSHINSV
ncbi:MAG: FtsX-like permease family protein [Candidatus Hermodarchaeia archaeon]|jgi:ABC-type lipoprotein release transport system permease subunit